MRLGERIITKMKLTCPKCGSGNIRKMNIIQAFYSVSCFKCGMSGIFALVQIKFPDHAPMDRSSQYGGHYEHGMKEEFQLVEVEGDGS